MALNQISVNCKSKKNIYLVGFLRRLQPKQSSPIKQFSLSKTISKEVNITANNAAIFFSLSPNSFCFSFPCSFLGGFSSSFCFWSFSCQKSKTFGTFWNIQQGNALAFTATYTLIFVNVLNPSHIQVSLFWSFLFSSW